MKVGLKNPDDPKILDVCQCLDYRDDKKNLEGTF